MSRKNKVRVGQAIGAVVEAIESRLLLSTTTFSIADATLAEGDNGKADMVFQVNRTGSLDQAVTVNFHTVDGTAHAGTDYVAVASRLTFAPGQAASAIHVQVIGNKQFQASRSFSVELTEYGSGLFADQQISIPGAFCDSVTTGDVNGDGILDLVTGNNSVLLGTGNGSFTLAQTYGTEPNYGSKQLGDFNGDGKLDLVVANYDDATVSIGLGNGDGTFQARVTLGIGPWNLLRTSDIDGDGKLDLCLATAGYTPVVTRLGNGGTSFAYAPAITTDAGIIDFTLADFDGDGVIDLATSDYTQSVCVRPGNGDGTFATAIQSLLGVRPRSLTAADFNGDGKLDLFVGCSAGYEVLLSKGDGTFSQDAGYATGIAISSLSPLVAGDFNADGNADIVTGDAQGNSVYLLPGTGQGTFGAPVILPHNDRIRARALAAGDFNGDGMLDLAVAGDTRNLDLLLSCSESEITLPDAPAIGTILDDDAPASLAIVAGDAQTGVAGRALWTPPAVVVKNVRGVGVQGVSVTFTAPPEGPGGLFPAGNSTTVLTDASGRAAAPAFVPNAALGNYALTASVDGVAPAVFALQNIANTAPTLKDAAIALGQGRTFAFDRPGFEAAFCDTGGDALQTVRITSLPAHGTLSFDNVAVTIDQDISVHALDSVVYTPDKDYSGSDAFTWNASDGVAWASTDARVNLTVVVAVATTVTLESPVSAEVDGQRPIVLKAQVTRSGPLQVPYTGTVTFVDLDVNVYANASYLAHRSLMPTSPVWLNNPADANSPIAGRVLGTATVTADGAAELSLRMLMPGARRIVAVFTGENSPLTPRTTGHDAAVTMAADAHDAWAARKAAWNGNTGISFVVTNAWYNAGSITLSGTGRISLAPGNLAGTTTWLASPPVKPELLPSISDESSLGVKFITTMAGGVSSNTTLTNPPALWFQMSGLAGSTETAPAIPSRGSILSASAGMVLTVLAPTGGSGGYSGSTTYSGASLEIIGGLRINPPFAEPEPPLPNPDPEVVPTGSVRIYDGDVLLDTVTLRPSFSSVFVAQPVLVSPAPAVLEILPRAAAPAPASLTLGTMTSRASLSSVYVPAPASLTLGTMTSRASLSGVYVPAPGSLALGTHQIRFVYDGDNCFTGFTREDSVEITHTATHLSISKSVDWLVQGNSGTFTATVSTATPDTVSPTGTVKFLVDGAEVAEILLGTANPLTLHLTAGTHTVTAQYSGDANCLPSVNEISLAIAPPVPTTPPTPPAPTPLQLTTLPSIVKPSTMAVTAKVRGRRLQLTASVLDKQTRKQITGTVEWRLDGKRVAAGSIGKSLTLTPKLAKGVHTLMAVYNATLGYHSVTKTMKLKVAVDGLSIVP